MLEPFVLYLITYEALLEVQSNQRHTMRKGTNTLAPCCESRRKSFQSKKPDISTMLGNNSPGHWQEGHDGPMNKDKTRYLTNSGKFCSFWIKEIIWTMALDMLQIQRNA